MRTVLTLASLPIFALAACASPEQQRTPQTPGSECEVAVDPDQPLTSHAEAMRGIVRGGDLASAIEYYRGIADRVASVERGSPEYDDRIELESMFTRAVLAREFLIMRTDRPDHPARPPVLPAWPVTPW